MRRVIDGIYWNLWSNRNTVTQMFPFFLFHTGLWLFYLMKLLRLRLLKWEILCGVHAHSGRSEWLRLELFRSWPMHSSHIAYIDATIDQIYQVNHTPWPTLWSSYTLSWDGSWCMIDMRDEPMIISVYLLGKVHTILYLEFYPLYRW